MMPVGAIDQYKMPIYSSRQLTWFGGDQLPRPWSGNVSGLTTVLKKFMRHAVPLALPASTLNSASGTLKVDVHFSAALSSLVVDTRPELMASRSKA